MQRPERDANIEQAEEQAGADHAEMRREHQRKQDGDHQRAEIVESEDLRHEILEIEIALQDAHHERDFQADQNADAAYREIEQQLERPGQPREHEKQADCRKAAEQADQQLDLDEAADQVARDVFR